LALMLKFRDVVKCVVARNCGGRPFGALKETV
jgi:hypothetical protein